MRWFTSERGRPVCTERGEPLGVVRDLVVAVNSGEHHPRVTHLVLGPRRRERMVGAAGIDLDGDGPVILPEGTQAVPARSDDGTIELGPDELLLERDILDTQVVDLQGHRVARVGDVAIEEGADGHLTALGVDVGMRPLLQRLKIGALAGRTADRYIDWNDLHLVSARGHDLQLAAPSSALHRLDAPGLAALLDRLDVTSGAEVLAAVPAEQAAEALVAAHRHTGERLLWALPAERAHHIVARMPQLHRRDWEERLGHRRPWRGRRFRRTEGWRRTPGWRRPPPWRRGVGRETP